MSCEKDEAQLSDIAELKTLEFNIGGWNMKKDNLHAISIIEKFNPTEMIMYEAWIVSENDNSITNLITYYDGINDFNGVVLYYTDDEIVLSRHSDSQYNSENYDNEDINRGTLIIKYR